MTICRRLLQTVIAGTALSSIGLVRAEAQTLPPITTVAIAPVSTALPGSYVISRFWNVSGYVTVVSVGAEPVPGGTAQPLTAVVAGGMALSNGRGGSFQIPGGAQVTGHYVQRNGWKTIFSCLEYDSIQVGGKTLPISGLGGCLPLGAWNVKSGDTLSWVAPDAGPEAFPEVAPRPAGEGASTVASS